MLFHDAHDLKLGHCQDCLFEERVESFVMVLNDTTYQLAMKQGYHRLKEIVENKKDFQSRPFIREEQG